MSLDNAIAAFLGLDDGKGAPNLGDIRTDIKSLIEELRRFNNQNETTSQELIKELRRFNDGNTNMQKNMAQIGRFTTSLENIDKRFKRFEPVLNKLLSSI